MKINNFKCHMCEEIFVGEPKMRVALVGFAWEPHTHSQPGELLDVCEACQHALLKAYAKARNERLEAVYEKGREAFLLEKIKNLTRERSVRGSVRPSVSEPVPVGGSMSRHSPAWNYSQNENKHPARFTRSTEAQKVWRF